MLRMLALLLLAFPAPILLAATSLEDSFKAALARAQTVAIDEELIKQAEETYHQAQGSMLPTINGVASYLTQQQVDGPGAAAAGPAWQPSAKLTASQPLFRGLRDFAGLRQTEGLISAAKLDRGGAVIQLYKDVVQAYYGVIAGEADARDLNNEMTMYEKRIAELEKFRRIGRSRLSEVLTASTQLANLKAQAKQVAGQIEANRQVLAVLTGMPTTMTLAEPSMAEASARFAPLEQSLKNIDQRPDVSAARLRAAAAAEGIAIARGAHLPNVDLNGDYYLKRSGPAKDVTWDVSLVMTLPIYSGGIIESNVAQAAAKKRQGDDQLEQARRAAEQEVRTLHANLRFEEQQIADLSAATDLAHRNYDEESREYRLGLVTNLDVLQALQTYQESQRALDRARFAFQLDKERYAAAQALRPVGYAASTKVGGGEDGL